VARATTKVEGDSHFRTVAGPGLGGGRRASDALWQLPLSKWLEGGSAGLDWLPAVSAFWNVYGCIARDRLRAANAQVSGVKVHPVPARPSTLLQPRTRFLSFPSIDIVRIGQSRR